MNNGRISEVSVPLIFVALLLAALSACKNPASSDPQVLGVSFTLPLFYNTTDSPVRPTVTASDVATYAWTASPDGVVFTLPDGQSPTITITGADRVYLVSVVVTDTAGNTTTWAAPICKDTSVPAMPAYGSMITAPGADQTSLMPVFRYPNPGASSNPYTQPDHFAVQVDRQSLPDASFPLPIMASFTVSAPLRDNASHTLEITQVDAAGNRSAPLDLDFFVTPVVPVDGSTAFAPVLFWRAFDTSPSVLYRVHRGTRNGVGGTFTESPGFPWDTTGIGISPTASGGVDYYWYIEWFSDGHTNHAPDGRSPADPTKYYLYHD